MYRLALDFLVFANKVIEALPCGRSHVADQFARAATSVVLNVAKWPGASTRSRRRAHDANASWSYTVTAASGSEIDGARGMMRGLPRLTIRTRRCAVGARSAILESGWHVRAPNPWPTKSAQSAGGGRSTEPDLPLRGRPESRRLASRSIVSGLSSGQGISRAPWSAPDASRHECAPSPAVRAGRGTRWGPSRIGSSCASPRSRGRARGTRDAEDHGLGQGPIPHRLSAPTRPPKARAALVRAPFPRNALARVSRMHKWRWEWAGAQRRGAPAFVNPSVWAAFAWCSVLVAEGETQLRVGVQLYPKCLRRAGGRERGSPRWPLSSRTPGPVRL